MNYAKKHLTESEYKDFIEVSAGLKPADLVFENGTYLDVFTNSFKKGNVALCHGLIAGIGNYKGNTAIDITGKTIVPGFVDGHIHIESTTVVPHIFAKEALKHGTTAILTDPHEIANVMGTDGIRYMLEASKDLPLDIFFMVPSCVPSCKYDESGAKILAKDMEEFLSFDSVLGIAEMMDYAGVINRKKTVLDKTYLAKKMDKLIDGHAPLVTNKDLMAYISAGVLTDHECATMDEALEKLSAGMLIMIREGTAAQNLEALISLCKEPYASRCMFCTDDRHINDIMDFGHIDNIIRKAIKLGADPAIAYKTASFTAGKYINQNKRGAISPGYLADFVILYDVKGVEVECVYKNGVKITDEYLNKTCKNTVSDELINKSHNTFFMPAIKKEMLESKEKLRVLGLVSGQLLTTDEGTAAKISVNDDILKAAVVERHKNTGHIGLGFIKGYGLKSGAIATSVAHDAHNIIAIGTNEEDMALAINELKNMGGGMIVYDKGKIKASYPLTVAGLMSETSAEYAKKKLCEIHEAAYALGVNKGIDPFMTLSFTALPVIPKLRITTHGVHDVTEA